MVHIYERIIARINAVRAVHPAGLPPSELILDIEEARELWESMVMDQNLQGRIDAKAVNEMLFLPNGEYAKKFDEQGLRFHGVWLRTRI